jgi:hypothetical protein
VAGELRSQSGMSHSVEAYSEGNFMLQLTAFEAWHSEDPALHFVGMAGFVAPLKNWQDFEEKCQPTLEISERPHTAEE